MSFSGLFAVGLSGVSAYSSSLEAVSNNIANAQTTGFKRVRTDFADLVSAFSGDTNGRAGGGVAASNRQLVAEQGLLARTNSATDLAVAGAGFFVVSETAGADASPFLFTRSGDFTPTAAGDLVNGAGYFLQGYALGADGAETGSGGLGALQTVNIARTPPLASGAPPLGDLLKIEIEADGRLFAGYSTGERIALFRIPLALFTNSQGLDEWRGTAFRDSSASGTARLVNAQTANAGAVESEALEGSTVDIGAEFSTLIATQRAYATNARIISAADEMWRALVTTAA